MFRTSLLRAGLVVVVLLMLTKWLFDVDVDHQLMVKIGNLNAKNPIGYLSVLTAQVYAAMSVLKRDKGVTMGEVVHPKGETMNQVLLLKVIPDKFLIPMRPLWRGSSG